MKLQIMFYRLSNVIQDFPQQVRTKQYADSFIRQIRSLDTSSSCTFHAAATDVCKSPGSSSDAVECSNQKYQKTEAELNEQYKQLLLKLDGITKQQPERLAELKPRFIAAQRAWVKFRKNECEAIQVWYNNGALQSALYFDAWNLLRKKELRHSTRSWTTKPNKGWFNKHRAHNQRTFCRM